MRQPKQSEPAPNARAERTLVVIWTALLLLGFAPHSASAPFATYILGLLLIYGGLSLARHLRARGFRRGSQTATHGSTSVEYRMRQSIPPEVRREVWRRDQGRCARCGSRENLEFDHIVPVSRGGSNTVRNIELLCQTCNRSKGARIE